MTISISILLLLIVLFLIISIGMVAHIFYSNKSKNKQKEQSNILKGKYMSLLIAFIDDGNISSLIELLNSLKNQNIKIYQKEKNTLLNEILSLHRNLKGEEASRLQGLFLTLDLKKDSLKRLQSSSWRKKVRGIQELVQMEVLNSYPLIAPYLKHKNINIRTAALTAKIVLDKQAFSFLDDQNSLLTDWQQLQIHQVLQKIHPSQIPKFSPWLNTSNESVICFCLKMIHHYDQILTDPQTLEIITPLLASPSISIQKNAIQTLSKIPSQTTVSLLLQLLQENKNTDIKILILELLKDMSTPAQLPFFEKQLLLLTKNDYRLQLATAKAIAGINGVGINRLKTIEKSAEKPLKGVIQHVLDQRI